MRRFTFVTTIPDRWKRILGAVQSATPEALLAGGALRDRVMGREPKDLDIFVPYNSVQPEVVEKMDAALAKLGYRYLEPPEVEEGASSELPDDAVMKEEYHYTSEHPDDLPINMIEVGKDWTPKKRLYHFDFGLCQIGYDGDRPIVTDAFQHDKDFECFTLLHAPTWRIFYQSLKRYRRFLAKYPKFPLVIKPDLVWPKPD